MGSIGPYLLVAFVALFLFIGLPVLVVVLWVRSGKSKSHAQFVEHEANKPSLGRLGE